MFIKRLVRIVVKSAKDKGIRGAVETREKKSRQVVNTRGNVWEVGITIRSCGMLT